MPANPELSDARLPSWASDLFSTPSLAEQGPAWIPSFVSKLERQGRWGCRAQGMGCNVLRDAGAFMGQVWLIQACLCQVARIHGEGLFFVCLFVCFKSPGASPGMMQVTR